MKIGPRYKIARRLGERIYPKTQTAKFALSLSKRKSPNGGGTHRRMKTDYGMQFLEKQKVRFTYGVSERQFGNYVKKAREKGSVDPATSLFRLLETRLDNIVFESGFTPSRAAARQAVSHGHFMINGRRVTVPSYSVSSGDMVSVRSGSRGNAVFKESPEKLKKDAHAPAWLKVEPDKFEVSLVTEPVLDSVSAGNLSFSSVMAFYSRV
jgi:small subunit ribosomal protein S4